MTAQPTVGRYVDPTAHVFANDLAAHDVINVGGNWYEALDVVTRSEDTVGILGDTDSALVKAGDDAVMDEYPATPYNTAERAIIAREDSTGNRGPRVDDEYRFIGARLATGEYVAVRILLHSLVVDGSAWGQAWVVYPKHWPVNVVRRFDAPAPEQH